MSSGMLRKVGPDNEALEWFIRMGRSFLPGTVALSVSDRDREMGLCVLAGCASGCRWFRWWRRRSKMESIFPSISSTFVDEKIRKDE